MDKLTFRNRKRFLNHCLEGDISTTLKVINRCKEIDLSPGCKQDLHDYLAEILAFQTMAERLSQDTRNFIKLTWICSKNTFKEAHEIFKKLLVNDNSSKSAKLIAFTLMDILADFSLFNSYDFKLKLPEELDLTEHESARLSKVVKEYLNLSK